MDRLQHIYEIIDREGISNVVVQEIDKYIEDIQNGTEDFSRFNLSEHAGLCTAGAPLIGASIIACYATASLAASSNVEGSKGCPTNWEIDRLVLEDMHPANVFIDNVSEKPICIDCIVKFVNQIKAHTD